MPWATFSKLTDYMVSRGFIEKTKKTVNNRKANFVRLTALGRELVRMYVGLLGVELSELESEDGTRAEAKE